MDIRDERAIGVELMGREVWLLPEKALYVPHSRSLVIADLHLGKSAHFRKAGIMMPQGVGNDKDYRRLQVLMDRWQPKRVLFLGDLFHSELNGDWHLFSDFATSDMGDIEMILIEGNHDVLHQDLYARAGLKVVPSLLEEVFIYSHEPLKEVPNGFINIAGHVHPGCVIRGLGRVHIKLPCFHRAESLLLLPSFGSLTGCHTLSKNGAKQYAIAKERLFVV
ncbi:ligase-associated DNA damage response endonuclease PdeM [Olivibacter sitiensis]|uniref:ligase-associated DNA damage response endonuclease PdeM n=1 Tax=Olivibacter sitiensis TaxID=376470 RepID=UPI0004137774|nr:ligase-associated DNA damage response endonuclease PdeM [Olivibacter sitiensis]